MVQTAAGIISQKILSIFYLRLKSSDAESASSRDETVFSLNTWSLIHPLSGFRWLVDWLVLFFEATMKQRIQISHFQSFQEFFFYLLRLFGDNLLDCCSGDFSALEGEATFSKKLRADLSSGNKHLNSEQPSWQKVCITMDLLITWEHYEQTNWSR